MLAGPLHCVEGQQAGIPHRHIKQEGMEMRDWLFWLLAACVLGIAYVDVQSEQKFTELNHSVIIERAQ
jgi:hypothetical protein